MTQNFELSTNRNKDPETCESESVKVWQTDNLYSVVVDSEMYQRFIHQAESGSEEFDIRGYFPQVKRLAMAIHQLDNLCFQHPLRYSFMLEAVASQVSTVITVWDSSQPIGCAVAMPALNSRYIKRLKIYGTRLGHFCREELIRTAYLEEIMVHPDYRGRGVLTELLRNLSQVLYQAGYNYLHGDYMETPRQGSQAIKGQLTNFNNQKRSFAELLRVHYPETMEIGCEVPGLTPLSSKQIFMVMSVEKLWNSFVTDLV